MNLAEYYEQKEIKHVTIGARLRKVDDDNSTHDFIISLINVRYIEAGKSIYTIVLISLQDGNRWGAPILFEGSLKMNTVLSIETLQRLIGDSSLSEWEIIAQSGLVDALGINYNG